MAIWETFENLCTNYLNETFGNYATFTLEGGSDSTTADILVTTTTGKSFYIEVKDSPAQCGQFVLLPDINNRTFTYSSKNASQLNTSSQKIIDHMNLYFDEFREAGTKGKKIKFTDDTQVFINWITQYYKNKGVEFFITNNFTLIPIDDFAKYFSVTATYRIKRSGSNSVGKNNINPVIDYIASQDYPIEHTHTKGDKLFIESSTDLHNQRFLFRNNEYMFSLRDNNFELRKLSNTYHANVIFSISLIPNILGISKTDFITLLG